MAIRSRAGQFFNNVGYIGVSSASYGTLTVFRNTSLTADGVGAFDPMQASYAFSPIGFSGVVAGGGDTENSRYSTSVKYRFEIGDFHAAALGQFGGYQLDNGSQGAWEAEVGGDIRNLANGVLSLDVIGGYSQIRGEPQSFRHSHEQRGHSISRSYRILSPRRCPTNQRQGRLAKYTQTERSKLLQPAIASEEFAPPIDLQTSFTESARKFVAEAALAFNMTNIGNTAYSARVKREYRGGLGRRSDTR